MSTMDELGFALLRRWEGCRLYAWCDYDDRRVKPGEKIFGTLTIGYGHTGPDVTPGLVWTQQQADDALVHDVDIFVQNIQPLIKFALSDDQFSALVCLAYNIGLHAFSGSSALHPANLGQLREVPDHILLWDRTTIDGVQVVSPGLKHRREAEVALWNT